MPIEILMPALSPTMKEGNLAKWLKKEGDKIEPGDVIAEIETDKATMEVDAVDEGTMGKILVPEGTDNVQVNEIIALLLEEGETASSLSDFTKSTPKELSPVKQEQDKLPQKENNLSNIKQNIHVEQPSNERIFISPLAKRIAEQQNVDLSNIKGTGPHGRIIKADIEQQKQSNVNLGLSNNIRATTDYTKIANSNIRKVIAKRLIESKQTIPHFYLSVECIMDNLLNVRKDMNLSTDENNPEYKLSVNDFIIKAAAKALAKVPEVNASWTDEAILMYNNVDISVAVAIEGGLITPIIKNADQKSIADLSNEMKSLAIKARNNELKPEEFQGGGFSISNLGMYGVKNFQAIVNPPQSCILAVGASTKRPIIANDAIKIGNVADFSLSCDHRVVDGAIGANFLGLFKKYIENPLLLFV